MRETNYQEGTNDKMTNEVKKKISWANIVKNGFSEKERKPKRKLILLKQSNTVK